MQEGDFCAVSAIIKRGGIIAYPTETVWGLGCDPWNEAAVYTLLDIKKRSVDKGLIIVAADISQVTPLLKSLSAQQRKRFCARTQKPTTWLIPDDTGWLPDCVKGNHSTAAVRISQHPVVRQLCTTIGQPIISTSANISGHKTVTKYQEAVFLFNKKLDMIIQGETGSASSPSSVIDLISGKVIR